MPQAVAPICLSRNEQELKAAFDSGASANARDVNDQTLLHFCALRGVVRDVLQLFVQHKVDLFATWVGLATLFQSGGAHACATGE